MGITHNIAVPPARIPDFVRRAETVLAKRFPEATPFVVGHLGDGNLRCIAMFSHADWSAVTDKSGRTAEVNHLFYDIAAELGGTFSAEHGIGSIYVAEMERYKTPEELALKHR